MRVIIPELPADSTRLTLRGEKARHLSVVLRAVPGDRITVVGPGGVSYEASVVSVSQKTVELELVSCLGVPGTESPFRIALFQSVLKGEKMDLIVQKATELGVHEIVPVVSERSLVRETRKISRWSKIAESAAQQSGRSAVPAVAAAVPFPEALTLHTGLRQPGILFWEGGGDQFGNIIDDLGSPQACSVFTGPEGGFSADEVQSAAGAGIRTATLGKRILRAETAAVVAVALLQFSLGDLS